MNASSLRYKNKIIARLRRAMMKRGQTAASVERRLGRGRDYVNDALAERKTLTVELIIEVLEALRMDVHAFFRGQLD